MKKSILFTAVSAATLLMSHSVFADNIRGTARADFNNDEIQIPCVEIEGYGNELDGQFFDIIMERRGQSFNYELVLAELEDSTVCEDIANYAIFVDHDAENDDDDSDDDDDTADPVANITLDTEVLDYGEFTVDDGDTSAIAVNIYNSGYADLEITSSELIGTNADDFRVVLDTGESTLTPGSKRTIAVVFNPSAVGELTAGLQLMTNDPDMPETEVMLKGTGI